MTDWSFFEAGRVFLPVAEPHDALSVASSCSTIFWRGVAWRGASLCMEGVFVRSSQPLSLASSDEIDLVELATTIKILANGQRQFHIPMMARVITGMRQHFHG